MAWRPTGSTSFASTANIRKEQYSTGEPRMRERDLNLTATGKAMLPRKAPLATSGVERRAAYARRPLTAYGDPRMASSERGAAFWTNGAVFDMYATTSGTAHGDPHAGGPVNEDVLKHPGHTKAPVSDRLHYALDDAALGRDHLDAAIAAAEERVKAAGEMVQAVDEAGDAMVERVASETFGAATRDLVTIDPRTMPFGSLMPESEAQAAYRRPGPGAYPGAGDHAVTYVRDNPDAGLGLNPDEREHLRVAAAGRAAERAGQAGQGAEQTQGQAQTARAPSSFRPVPVTGMTSTTHATYVPQPDPDASYHPPASALVATAQATAVAPPAVADAPGMWETTSGSAYGAYVNMIRPVTAPASSLRGSLGRTRPPSVSLSVTGAGVRGGTGTGTEPLRTTQTEYHAAFDRTRATQPQEHHRWL